MKASSFLIATTLLASIAVALLMQPRAAISPSEFFTERPAQTETETEPTCRPIGLPSGTYEPVFLESTDESENKPREPARFDDGVTVCVLVDGALREMTLHDYLIGVLLAEMPGYFEPDALKAQAVASRSFTLYKANVHRHGQADVCSSPACCQAWKDPTQYDEATVAVFREAVESTDGLVATYEGEVIEAAFFASTGGATESAETVWGNAVPYLQSVKSVGEAEANYHGMTLSYTPEEFSARLRETCPDLTLADEPEQWLGAPVFTQGGGLSYAEIGDQRVSGRTLQRAFALRSTHIRVSFENGRFVIRTQGYGHRVGLSQYGAQEMALRGARFEEILTHYYQGCVITQLVNG